MKMYYLTFLLSIASVLKATAQEAPPMIDPLRYLPSPSAAELGSYGQIPVGLFSGTPEINIPLYEIKTRNLSLPVSLNYRSNGLLVNKVASNVGFDWSLFAGGIITRIVKGFPDDASRYLRVPYPVDPAKAMSEITPEEEDELVAFYFTGWNPETDTQPDLFSYNFAGYSGQFYVADNQQVITIPYQKLRIETPTKYHPFTITTPDGVIYEFKASETSGQGIETSISAYNLSKITHPEGDEIKFYYKASGSYWYKTAISNNLSHIIAGGYNGGSPCPYALPVNHYPLVSESFIFTTILDSIVAPGYGKVIFETDNNRLDMPELRLKGLKVLNSSGQKIKAIELYHQFPYTTNHSNDEAVTGNQNPVNNENVYYRMFLDSVVFKNNQETPVERYSFAYRDLANLPIRLSYSQDHWGYFNGANNQNLFPDEIPADIKSSWFPGIFTNADRNPNGSYAQKGMLIRINYPTGGYTVFEYEPHKDNSNKIYGGVRLLKQTNYNSNGSFATSKRYVYSNGYANIRGLKYYVQHNFSTICIPIAGSGGGYIVPRSTTFNVFWLRSSPVLAPGTMGYETAKVYYEENNQYGSEEHKFHISADDYDTYLLYGQFALHPPPLTNFGWKTGQKKEEKYFNQNSALVKSIEYLYEEDPRNESTQHYVSVQQFYPTGSYLNGYTYIRSYFNVSRYSIISKWQYLKSKITRNYDQNGSNPVISKTDYYYDHENHAQLSREISATSTGGILEKRMYYPQDYSDLWSFGTLTGKFILNKPVDLRVYKGNQLISGFQTKHNGYGQPLDVYKAEINSSIQDIPFDAGNPFTFTHKLAYQYNANKLLTSEQSNSGVANTYIWSYKNTLPVAKIENADYSDVVTATANLGFNFLTYLGNENNQSSIDSDLSALRAEIKSDLPGALITTFTYYPLVGMSSSTDTNEKKTYFEYDGFGRLSSVKGNDLSIVNAYRYHYVPPSALPRLEVLQSSLGFHYPASSQTFQIESHGAWSISANQGWIHTSATTGNGNVTITVTVDENPAYAWRSGTITIKDQSGNHLPDRTVSIGQNAHPNYVNISLTSLSFIHTAESKMFQITSNVSWDVTSNQAWISVTPGSGSGNNTITVTATQNTSFASRTAALTIRDLSGNNSPNQSITVTQEGVPSYMNVTPSELSFTAAGQTKTFQISANLSWSVTDNQPWISATPASGSGNGTVSVTVSQNTAATSRTSVISINDQSGGGNFQQILITQPGTSNYITVSPTGFYLNSSNVDAEFNISSNLTSWNTRINYISGSDWLDDIYPRSGMGNRNGVDIHVNQLPPSGQTWHAEIEVYNTSSDISAKLFVYVTN